MRRLLTHTATFRRSKHARFCVVSFNGVVFTQIALVLFVHGLGWSAVVANLVAVSLSCLPSFLLNRYWVWGHAGRRNLGSQIVAFWAMALVGLAVSTLVVSWLDQAWDSPVVANVGNIIGFGGIWIAKFFVLDRVMFRHGTHIGVVDLPLVDPVADAVAGARGARALILSVLGRALAGAAALALALGATACGDDDGTGVPPVDTTVRTDTVLRVDQVAPAIAAVETALGGPQRYTEINVNPEGVTLFVAIDDSREVAYFYDGALDAGAAPAALTGTPFTLDGVGRDLAPDLVRRTQADLPGSQVTQLALVTTPELGLVWAAASRSARGGVLNVFYSPSGELLSAAPDP